jgi:membrane protein YdbS with pleckstrin-like domain
MYSPKLTKSGPFPTSAILVILAIVILAVTPSLLLYRRHRKNNSNPPISKIFKYTTNCEFGVS